MSFESNVIIKSVPTKPVNRGPNTRATLRDLNSARALQVFRRPSIIRRLLQLFTPKK